jgi:hypothetical protein
MGRRLPCRRRKSELRDHGPDTSGRLQRASATGAPISPSGRRAPRASNWPWWTPTAGRPTTTSPATPTACGPSSCPGSARPALRLPRPRPVEPRDRGAVQPGQAAARSLRPRDHRRRRLLRPDQRPHARVELPARPARLVRVGAAQRRGGRQRAAAPAGRAPCAGGPGGLRDAPEGLHPAAPGRARAPARHLRGHGLPGRRRAPDRRWASTRSSSCPSTTSSPSRSRPARAW